MKPNLPRLSALGAMLAIVSAAVFIPSARSQIQATPSYLPIGVATTGSTSMVWFHDPSTGKVVACQSAASGGGLSAVQCVVGKLP